MTPTDILLYLIDNEGDCQGLDNKLCLLCPLFSYTSSGSCIDSIVDILQIYDLPLSQIKNKHWKEAANKLLIQRLIEDELTPKTKQ